MAPVVLGPFVLDPRTRVLTRDGEIEKIPLRTIEVLVALVERRGEIVTKDELLARVWKDSVVEEANLTVHVSLLRRTLGDAAPIETVSKRGYRMLALPGGAPAYPGATKGAGAEAGAGGAGVTAGGSGSAARGVAEDDEARNDVLRGRYFWNKLTRAGLEKAAAAFSRALESDPGSGAAHAGLADARLMQGLYGFDSARSVFEKARRHADAAMRLAPDSPDALVSHAFTTVFDAWDLETPRAAIDRARALAPGRADPILWSAFLHALRGEFLKALADVRAAQALDPLSLQAGVGSGFHLYLAQQAEPDPAPLLRVLDLEPEYAPAHWALGLARDRLGDHALAENAHRAAVLHSGGSPTMESNLARSLALAGRRDEARALRDRLAAEGLAAYRVAAIDLALDDRAGALDRLEEGLKRRDPWLVLLRVDPMFADLRDERRCRDVERAVYGG